MKKYNLKNVASFALLAIASVAFAQKEDQPKAKTCGWLCQTAYKLQIGLGIINEDIFQTYACGNQVIGYNKVCSGLDYEYKQSKTATTDQIDFISWTVSPGGEIVDISGVDVQLMQKLRADYLKQLGITVDVPVILTYVFIDDQNCVVNYKGQISNDISFTQNANGSITLIPDPTNPQSLTFMPNASANIDYSNNLAISNKITKECSDISTGDKGKTIKVRFDGTKSNVTVGFSGTRNVKDACGGNFSGSMNVEVLKTPDVPNISGLSESNISCNQSLNLSTPYQNGVVIGWECSGATFWNSPNNDFPDVYEGTNVSIGKFKNTGTYTLKTTAVSACGEKEVQKTINVGLPNITLNKNGLPVSGTITALSCQEYNNSMNLSIEPWTSNNAAYYWTLPAGWRSYSATPISTTTVNGVPQYTYAGNNLRYMTITKINNQAIGGDVIITGSNICDLGGDFRKVQTIETPQLPTFSLPANVITCDNQKEIQPTFDALSGTVARARWSASGMEGWFLNSQDQYNVNVADVKNTYTARKFANGTVTLTVTDVQGCNYSQSTNLQMFGGEGSEFVSGWLSGHINPSQTATVQGNIEPTTNTQSERIYFTRNVNGQYQIWFYEFDIITKKWKYHYAGINSLPNSRNLLQYQSSSSDVDYLYYVNANGKLTVAFINEASGESIGVPVELSDINIRDFDYGFKIQELDAVSSRVVWKDELNNLKTSVIFFDKIGDKTTPTLLTNETKTIVTRNFNLDNSVLIHDFDVNNQRYFYFKKDGGFYVRSVDGLGNLKPEIQLNQIFNFNNNDIARDLVIDNNGDIYFVVNNDMYYVDFDDENLNYLATYKIETTEGVASNEFQPSASGYVTINEGSNTLYYIGSVKGDIYQMVRNPDFELTKSFKIIKSTPFSFNDRASSSISFQGKHVYYKSSDNQVYNLFYIEQDEISCVPEYLRTTTSDIYEEAGTTLQEANSGILNGQLFPNPTENIIYVDVWGVENTLGTLEIFDMQGKLMSSMSYDFKPQTIDLSDLDNGMYLLKVSSTIAKNPISFKVVKK